MKVLLKKRCLWVPWTVHRTHWKSHHSHRNALKKKNPDANDQYPNGYWKDTIDDELVVFKI